MKILDGEKITEPVVLSKEGYQFICWFNNCEKFNFNTPIVTSLTLTAVWEVNVYYTVTIIFGNGQENLLLTVLKGEKINKPTNLVKENYEFTGWQVDGNSYDFNQEVISDIQVVANYKEKTIK